MFAIVFAALRAESAHDVHVRARFLKRPQAVAADLRAANIQLPERFALGQHAKAAIGDTRPREGSSCVD
jgi:hypothetical protein